MGKFLGLRGRGLDLAVGSLAGCVFLLFGYNQGVMSGILTMPDFLRTFPIIDPAAGSTPEDRSARSTYQGISVASYTLGCVFGAVITIFIGNPLGRKKMIVLGTATMFVGAVLQASAITLPHFVVGRVITGIGNGGNTSTIPTWQAETTRAHKRGKMVLIDGALITCGIMISYWLDYGLSFASGSVAWRFPLALQLVFCVVILASVPFLPESPRWLVFQGRHTEAKEVLTALYDVEITHHKVESEFLAIQETVTEMSKGKFSDLYTMGRGRNLHRTALGYSIQVFQQLSGINLITFYAAVIYKQLGMSDSISRLLAALNGTEYALASIPAIFLVERVGRRKLLLFGAIGQAVTMALLAGVNSRSDKTPFQIANIVFLFVFNTFFALGWLGTSWLYPAEIVPLRIRAPANALSTSSNYIFNFIVVMITPVLFNEAGYRTYIIFAIINALIIPCVYFFFPETAYRSLEEMDSIFHKVDGWKGIFAVVKQAKIEPRLYGQDGELLVIQDPNDERHRRAHDDSDTPSPGIDDDTKVGEVITHTKAV
ncbi:general substrate transporter [Cercophora newfieldiana]|uniref:General substrate transporter n=1 Tax=Cercophora newfieldiana TaxID=92897 RepID=A0AA39YH72_9PEZI|nr:general substrate transporter [Cercophora newfieldiana]